MPAAPRPARTRFPRNVWVLSITSFLTDVSSEMLLNLLPLFLFNVLGVKTSVVGLIEGLAETTASLVKIASGALSDKMKKRKTLAVVGYSLSAVAKPFLYFAQTWGWVLGVRFTDRVGKGIRTAPRDAMLAGSVTSEQRGLAFGLHRTGDTAGAFTGIGLAALIIWLTQASAAELSRQTFQWVVVASIVPAVLGVAVLAWGAREVQPEGEESSGAAPAWRGTGFDRRFKGLLAAVMVFTLGNSSDAFIVLRAQERGLSVLQVMGMLLTFNAVYTVFSGPLGSLSDRVGRRRLILGGWLVYAVIYLGLASAGTGAQIWGLYAVYGLYYAATEGTAKALVADLVPAAQRGTAYGLYHAAVGLAALPASLAAGVLWQGVGPWAGLGPAAPFYFGAGMAVVAGGLLFWVLPE